MLRTPTSSQKQPFTFALNNNKSSKKVVNQKSLIFQTEKTIAI
jgi:hypothetical protein